LADIKRIAESAMAFVHNGETPRSAVWKAIDQNGIWDSSARAAAFRAVFELWRKMQAAQRSQKKTLQKVAVGGQMSIRFTPSSGKR
jgi:hypothetical protein